jgi:hypothetical protein
MAALAVAVIAAIPLLRARVRREIESRCARLTEGDCAIGRLELARDGVVARDLVVHFHRVEMAAQVGFLAATLSWPDAILGRDQDISFVVDGVRVTDRGSVADAIREWSRLRRRRGGRPGGRTRVASARIDGIAIALGGGGAELAIAVTGGSAEWSRNDGLRVEWADARAHVADASARSGHCVASWPTRADQRTSVRCESPRLEVDANDVERVVDAIGRIEAAMRGDVRENGTSVASAAVGETSTEREIGSDSAALMRAIRFSARNGSVRIVRGAALIADLSPLETSVEFLAGSVAGNLQRAHVRLGDGEDTTQGPDVSIDFEREAAGRRWHADVDGDGLPLADIARWLPVVPWHATENGRVRIRVRAEPADGAIGALVVDGQIAVESFGLFHPGLGHDPIDDLTVTLEGAARVDLPRRRIETEGLRATVNGIGFAIAGWAERPEAREVALDASLRVPTTDCDGIRRALPASITGPVDEITFAGTIGADLHLALDTRALPATQLDIDVDERCAVVRDNMMLGIRRTRGVFVQRVTEPTGVRAFVTGPGSAAWVPLAQISPYVQRALLVREDGAFFRHHGFNPGEIRAAIIRNVAARRFVYGASTISMQLAKNIFLQREKTLVRKLQEVVLTWYLEHSLDKDAILELYLNVVEFGPGIYGIGPAARFFFGREPSELTPLQSAYLATLLPSPVARFANYQRGAISNGMLSALRAVVRRMAALSYLSPEEAQFAQTETIVFRPENVPVRGSLTQTVDVSTTDEMAQQMAPPATEIVSPSGDSAGAVDEGGASQNSEGDSAAE